MLAEFLEYKEYSEQNNIFGDDFHHHSLFDDMYNENHDIRSYNENTLTQNINHIINERARGQTVNDNFEGTPDHNEEQVHFIGRIRKGETREGKHNKFSYDNKLRKSKGLVYHKLFNFINNKIAIVNKGKIGHGTNIKQLKLLKYEQIKNANIDFNKVFLKKTLGEIFSGEVSKRINNFKRNHNKILIDNLRNEKDEEKKDYFNGLFNLTFLDCLKYFRGENSPDYIYIEGLERFSDLENDDEFMEENDEEYIKCLKQFFNEYEETLNYKKGKRPKKIMKKYNSIIY